MGGLGEGEGWSRAKTDGAGHKATQGTGQRMAWHGSPVYFTLLSHSKLPRPPRPPLHSATKLTVLFFCVCTAFIKP